MYESSSPPTASARHIHEVEQLRRMSLLARSSSAFNVVPPKGEIISLVNQISA